MPHVQSVDRFLEVVRLPDETWLVSRISDGIWVIGAAGYADRAILILNSLPTTQPGAESNRKR